MEKLFDIIVHCLELICTADKSAKKLALAKEFRSDFSKSHVNITKKIKKDLAQIFCITLFNFHDINPGQPQLIELYC